MDGKFYQVKVSEQAEDQMREIARYIAVDLQNKTAAIELLDLFQAMMDSLCRLPERIALTEEEPWRQQGESGSP
jgi:toxin ParE1/3/4